MLIGAACVMLGGCITPEQLAVRDDATCQSYGAQPGTDRYTNCRLQVAQQRQQALQAFYAQLQENNRRQAEANAQVLRDYQQSMPRQTIQAPTTTTCTQTSQITVSCNTF